MNSGNSKTISNIIAVDVEKTIAGYFLYVL